MQKPAEPIALFDMDGTLANYDTAMQRDLRLIASPNELELASHRDGAPEYLKTRMNMIRSQPGWWHNLEKYAPGFEILNVAKELKFQCSVLTKGPKRAVAAWTEKATWCANHVPDMPITIAQDKGLVYGKVLVDDWPEYVTRWLEWRPRGLVIMPAHPWNEGYVHRNVIRYTGKNLDEVRAGLVAARATCGD